MYYWISNVFVTWLSMVTVPFSSIITVCFSPVDWQMCIRDRPVDNFKEFASNRFPFLFRDILKIVHNHNLSFYSKPPKYILLNLVIIYSSYINVNLYITNFDILKTAKRMMMSIRRASIGLRNNLGESIKHNCFLWWLSARYVQYTLSNIFCILLFFRYSTALF